MFQVASHPTHFARPVPHRPSPPRPASPSVQLPRRLDRPRFSDVSRDAIIAAAPELAQVPAEYIRRGLLSDANKMLAGISSLAPSHLPSSLPRSHLPPTLSIPLRTSQTQPSYPSHVLAVTSSKSPSSSSSEQALVFPVHALVLASHCALLPRLPKSPQQPHSPSLHLPVLPLSLPSPAAFALLHAYMYSHRLDALLKSLFPVPAAFSQSVSHQSVRAALASGATLHQLSAYLCSSASNNLRTLTTHAAHVKDLWQTVAALGLYDPELWDTVDLAWEIVLGALNLAAASNN